MSDKRHTTGFAGERPYLIVLGNEKGGSGKSTTAMHIVVALLYKGLRVGTIDLDGRQRTLTRYIENRRTYLKDKSASDDAAVSADMPMPIEMVIERSEADTKTQSNAEEKDRFEAAYGSLMDQGVDAIVVDCPGSDSFLSRLAHTAADTLITPVNDSFVDIDLLALVDGDSHDIVRPSLYSEMVFKARQRRQMANGTSIDWIVIRNRVASLHAKNKERVDAVLEALKNRIGMRYVAGLSERVIYRELFLKGLTLMDLRQSEGLDGRGLTMSHVAARAELRRLMAGLALPEALLAKGKEAAGVPEGGVA